MGPRLFSRGKLGGGWDFEQYIGGFNGAAAVQPRKALCFAPNAL